MIYACKDCGFLFSRVGEVRECPSCESGYFRPATAEESERLLVVSQNEKSTSFIKEDGK